MTIGQKSLRDPTPRDLVDILEVVTTPRLTLFGDLVIYKERMETLSKTGKTQKNFEEPQRCLLPGENPDQPQGFQ